ncbi:type II secretion system F family protein [Candidatus Poribacteria bacterium]|nr:type II secretion system F family protein [Candidatus Poribacteria bacterium]
MPTFVYTVRNQKGLLEKRTSKAENTQSLVTNLRNQGLVVTEIKQKKALSSIELFKPKVKVHDLSIFSRQFATMQDAGVPLTDSLDILTSQTVNPTLSKATAEIKNEVEGGGTLSEAMAKYPKIFSKLYISMVKAGEASGAFETVFNQLALILEKELALRNKVKSALFLPTLILGFCLLITIGLIVFIVPRFAAVFENIGGKLPGPTQMLINVSNDIRGPKGLMALGTVIVCYMLFRSITSTEKGAYGWDKIKLKMPLFGNLFNKKAVASFARTFALLNASGVSILEALDIVSDTSGNRVIGNAIKDAKNSIQQGDSISKPLGENKVFPPMVNQMIIIGENTGNLENMLNKIADLYEDEVDRTVEGLTKLIEPVMMIFVGAIVGTILICLYLPIFNMADAIGTEG